MALLTLFPIKNLTTNKIIEIALFKLGHSLNYSVISHAHRGCCALITELRLEKATKLGTLCNHCLQLNMSSHVYRLFVM
jgi:hypothetical protein